MARKIRFRTRKWVPTSKSLARFLLKTHLLTIFVALCVLGIVVGVRTRPDPRVVPYAELFGDMSVVSYRDSPADTTARFLVQLSAGGKTFQVYDVDARRFLPPSSDREYNRAITGTVYPPLRARGHVAQGLWLTVSRRSAASLLPEQFRELYAATLDFVKPISTAAGVLGTLSGYSVGYRLGIWNSSLHSRAVQRRVLATPDLGRIIAREAWRRVLLEPALMGSEDDASRFAALRGRQRVYAGLVRVALRDSDGFIPREAARLAALGHGTDARAMLAFADAVGRASIDTLHLTSADFSAVEGWASLLMRRGHWAHGAMPPAGEERARYLGMLAWYGVAPSTPDADRVWVGPRVMVREGDTEGFVTDEIPATDVGCPIGWRALLRDQETNTNELASSWLSDHPEFAALATLADRVGRDVVTMGRRVLASRTTVEGADPVPPTGLSPGGTTAGFTSQVSVRPLQSPGDSARPAFALHGDTLSQRDSSRNGTGEMPAVPRLGDTLHTATTRDSTE